MHLRHFYQLETGRVRQLRQALRCGHGGWSRQSRRELIRPMGRSTLRLLRGRHEGEREYEINADKEAHTRWPSALENRAGLYLKAQDIFDNLFTFGLLVCQGTVKSWAIFIPKELQV